MKLKTWWTRCRPVRLARRCAPVMVIIIALGVGCAPTPSGTPREAMPTQTPQLVGNWEKITDSTCSQVYPDMIQFQERGLYSGQMTQPGTFTQWDVGTYEVIGHKQIKLSTANDAVVTYEFAISKDVLKFVDASKCEFSYRRVP